MYRKVKDNSEDSCASKIRLADWIERLGEELEDNDAFLWLYFPRLTPKVEKHQTIFYEKLNNERVFVIIGPQEFWLCNGALLSRNGKNVMFSDDY